MGARLAQLVLVLAAAALLASGLVRAAARGEPALRSWTTYLMVGLVLLAACNIAVRRRALAVVVAVLGGLLLLLALAAAALEQVAGSGHPPRAVLEAVGFFLLLLVAAGLQLRAPGSRADIRHDAVD